MVVDCGGGTVDLTVHQIRMPEGHLKELYKASGGSGLLSALQRYVNVECCIKRFNIKFKDKAMMKEIKRNAWMQKKKITHALKGYKL